LAHQHLPNFSIPRNGRKITQTESKLSVSLPSKPILYPFKEMKKFFTPKNVAMFLTMAVYSLSMKAQVTFTNMGALLQNIGGTSQGDCAADMNGDGLDDIVRVLGNGIYLDYQQIDGSFEPAFFPMAIQNLPSWSIVAADIDGNGYNDLCLGAGNALSFVYANADGTGYSEDAFPEYIFTQRSTFADIDNDGNLDAFANHDVDQCHPYRNVNGVLELDFDLIQTLDAGGNYAAIWVDYDNDWDSDLYITKCRGGASWGDPQRINLLYRNNGDGTYTEAGAEANMNDGNQSWTTVFEDFDNDGDFDAFTVNHPSGDVPGGAANKFMLNDGTGYFTDVISTTGINANDLGAWNCDAGDFDNDGFVDIFSEMGNEMYWNNGDLTFTGSQLSGFNSGGIGDFNSDGFLDVISGNSLWINEGNNNNYIMFDLEGIESNKSAVGARIEIYGDWGVQIREVRAGESFDPGSSLITHFGIGQATEVDQVVIKWPSQMVTTINNPEINMSHFVLEAGCMGDPIAINANGNTQICPGGSVSIEAPAGAASYSWSNGATGNTIEASNQGGYYVIAFNDEGCASVSNTIVVDIIEEEAPVLELSGPDVFCEGETVVLTSSIAQTYTWSNGATTQSIVVTESGDYQVTVEGACDGVAYVSDVMSLEVLPTAQPIANDVIIGEPGTADLVASGDNLNWYATETSTEVLGTGSVFTTPMIDNTISYWVSSTTAHGGLDVEGGRLDNSGSGGLPSSGGRLFFDIYEPLLLEQVTVFVPETSTAGNRTIQLFNSANQLIASAVVNCNIGTNVIDLNFDLPVANGLQIGCAENNLFRNNGTLEFPYAIGTSGSISTTTFGEGYYYYFYDWKLSTPEILCESDRIEVSASVVGIDELTNPLGVRLYPNPANNAVTMSGEFTGNALVEITDATGRVVFSRNMNMNGQSNMIDISEFSTGVYNFRVISQEEISSVQLVKQ
jgi:hypothetical protein